MFNTLKSVAAAALNPAQQEKAAIAPALLSAVKAYPGGVGGLIAAFNQGGLSAVVASWLGQNATQLPVSTSQLESVLGNTMISDIAKQSGLDTNKVLGHLTSLLPALISSVGSSGDSKLDVTSLLGALLKTSK